MKLIIQIIILISYHHMAAQEIVELPVDMTNEAIKWDNAEKEYHSSIWNTQVITNVSVPRLQVFRPDPEISNGTSVIICPGGGLYALSIKSEGRDVAQWLNEKGVTAFVLSYRLVPTGEDGTQDLMTDGENVGTKVKEVLPMSIADGLSAISHVRMNEDKYGINPDRIGLMGFSAGGAVTMGVTYQATEATKPNYIIPVYAWMDVVEEQKPPVEAPPIFVVCASDDPLSLAPASVKLYQQWLEKGVSSELHMYAEGGHGFGMREQDLPSDEWIVRFGEWLDSRGLLTK